MDKPHNRQGSQEEPFEAAEELRQEPMEDEGTPASHPSVRASEDGPALDLENDRLYLEALDELRNIKSKISLSAQERENNLRTFLARAYALSMEGKRNRARHDALVAKTGITVRKDTPHHKQTIRALQRKLGEPLPKGSEHEWAQVLSGLEEAEVGESEDAVVKFLTEPAEIGDKRVCGFERAHAVLRSSNRLKDEKKARRNQLTTERADFFDRLLAAARDQPVGGIDAAEDEKLDDGPWISINEGKAVLLKLQATDENIQALALRHAKQP